MSFSVASSLPAVLHQPNLSASRRRSGVQQPAYSASAVIPACFRVRASRAVSGRRAVVTHAAASPIIQLPEENVARELLEEQLRGTVSSTAAARDNIVAVEGLSVDVPLGVRVRLGDGGVRGLLLGRLDGLSFVLVTEGKATSVVEGVQAEVESAFAVVQPSEGLLGRTIEASSVITYVDKGLGSWCGLLPESIL